MPTHSALVATIHQLLAHQRIDLSALASTLQIPLATIRRMTSPATAPVALAAWESLLKSVDATVHLNYAGERYPVHFPALNRNRMQAVYERMIGRTESNRRMRFEMLATSPKAITKIHAEREVQERRQSIETALTRELPAGTHHTASIFAPAAVMIAGVANTATLGRSCDALELVTGVRGRTHQLMCLPDEPRPMAILQSVLALVGIVVEVEISRAQSRWIIGQPTTTPTTFLKAVNQKTGATRGAPARKHLPSRPSQILAAILGDPALTKTLIATAHAAGISVSTRQHWQRRQRDPVLEALEMLVGALGGEITLHGRIERHIAPMVPTPERLDQAFQQTCSAYRCSVSRATGLTKDGLLQELQRRVEQTRTRVREHLRLMPATTDNGIVAWIRARRAALYSHQLGSVLELSLITGLNRGVIDRILLNEQPLDEPYRLAFQSVGISVTVSTRK